MYPYITLSLYVVPFELNISLRSLPAQHESLSYLVLDAANGPEQIQQASPEVKMVVPCSTDAKTLKTFWTRTMEFDVISRARAAGHGFPSIVFAAKSKQNNIRCTMHCITSLSGPSEPLETS